MKAPANRLDQLIRERSWDVIDFRRAYREIGGVELPDRTAHWWVSGNVATRPRGAQVKETLEKLFHEGVDSLFGPPAKPSTSNLVTLNRMTEVERVMTAGRESVEHARAAAASIQPGPIEQVLADARLAASEYFNKPPFALLVDLVSQRNAVYDLLKMTNKPRQKAELYAAAGQLCGLLSSVSWDLGQPAVAADQARAAYTYGQLIDEPSLCSWARALEVTIALWSSRPKDAKRIAEAAILEAPRGTARVRLYAVYSRALAMLGSRKEVESTLNLMQDELELAGQDLFLDETGGELAFDRARATLCASSAYVALGDSENAESNANLALGLFAEQEEENRWTAGQLAARIDLGAARVIGRDLAGAEDSLLPVLRLSRDMRTEALIKRLENMDKVLGTQQFRGSIEATRISERIKSFAGDAIGRVKRPEIESGLS